jgi:hypothetical protein
MEGKSYGTNGIVSAADRVVFDDIQNRSFNHER